MTAVLDAARLQLGAWRWVVFAWVIVALSFSVNIAIATLGDVSFTTGGISIVPVFAAVLSSTLVLSWWPFAAGLSVTRARFLQANLLVALGLGAGTGLAVLLLTELEAATGGWGSSLIFFGVLTPVVSGPFQAWLVLVSVYLSAWVVGLFFAAVHKRWGGIGTAVGIGATVLVPGALVGLVTVLEAWPAIGRWSQAQTVPGVLLGLVLVTAGMTLGTWLVLRRAAP